MKNLDDVLRRLEEQEEDYQLALTRLVGVVKKARALYESEQHHAAKIRQ